MTATLQMLLNDPAASAELAASGLETIRARHTCAHRVDALLAIVTSIVGAGTSEEPTAMKAPVASSALAPK